MFSYIYSLHYVFLPTSSNIILGVIGIIWYLMKSITDRRGSAYLYSRSNMLIFAAIILLFSSFIIAIGFNGTSDYFLIKKYILTVISFFGAYAICQIIQLRYKTITPLHIGRFLTYSALLQVILTVGLFFASDSLAFITQLLNFGTLAKDRMSALEGVRLLGFGVSFFTAGYIHSFILIVIGAILRYYDLDNKSQLFYLLSFIFISVISVMMARTTLVGIALGGILMFKPMLKHGKKNLILLLSMLGIIVTYVIFSLSRDTLEMIQSLFEYGFELFINIFIDHSARTGSTDLMYSMYVFPTHLKTWIIGDGYFLDPDLLEYGYYYMGTDIGFLRLIFFSGLIGLIVYYIYEFTIIKETYRRCGFGKAMFFAFGILFLLVLLKGFADLAPYIMLFYFSHYRSTNHSTYEQ